MGSVMSTNMTQGRLTFFVVIPSNLMPFLRSYCWLLAARVWRRVVSCSLTGSWRLCSGLDGLETKVLHASLLLLVVVTHAERCAFCAGSLCLKCELCRLRNGHLVVCESGGSGVSHARRVCTVLVDVELLLHLVVVSGCVVCGKERRGGLVAQVVGVDVVDRGRRGARSGRALVARIPFSLVRSVKSVAVRAQAALGRVGGVASRIRHLPALAVLEQGKGDRRRLSESESYLGGQLQSCSTARTAQGASDSQLGVL